MVEGTGFTGMPYPTHVVEPLAAEPPMAHRVSEPLACGSSYVGIHEPTSCHDPDAFRGAPTGVCPPTVPASTMPEHGFTSLSGLRGLESCGGKAKGSERSSNKSLTCSEIREALCGATADLVGGLTQEIRARTGAPDTTSRASCGRWSFPSPCIGQPPGRRFNSYPRWCEKSTNANPCGFSKEPLRAKNSTITLQPCGEFHTR